jgi:glycosyltransferase involved in cell wall biosynthesis
MQQTQPNPGGWLLHVGSHVWYKNKPGLLHLYAAVRAQYQAQGKKPIPRMIWVSPPLTHELQTLAHSLEIVPGKDLIVVSHAANAAVAALYSHAGAVLLPSWFEGFGWPIVEAHHCAAWVVTTQRAPMTELGGLAATYLPMPPWEANATLQAQALQAWAQQCAPLVCHALAAPDSLRQAQRQRSLAQARPFNTAQMTQRYLSLYQQLAEGLY